MEQSHQQARVDMNVQAIPIVIFFQSVRITAVHLMEKKRRYVVARLVSAYV